MSSALAIAGVTAVLRDLLNDGLINHNVAGVLGSTVTVTIMPPDRVIPDGGDEPTALNLFLHSASPNQGWRNEGLPAMEPDGRSAWDGPPLALDLHFWLSAYASADLHSEILLGYGMQLLHEHPVLTRKEIRIALEPAPDTGTTLPAALRALDDTGLGQQLEQVRITPRLLDTEELARLWTATQAHYRPTAAYTVSVVLIESVRPSRSPLPVLTRDLSVEPSLVPPVPTLEAVSAFGGQPTARLGDVVTLAGHHLDGSGHQIRLTSDRLQVEQVRPAGSASADAVTFAVPVTMATDVPVGVYQVDVELIPSGATDARRTNRLPLVIAPNPTNLPQTVARDPAGDASFTLDFTPQLRPDQSAEVAIGTTEVAPVAPSGPVGSLTVDVPDAPAGTHLVRLRIDGIDSPIVDRSAEPPTFLAQEVTFT